MILYTNSVASSQFLPGINPQAPLRGLSWIYLKADKFASIPDAIECCWEIAKNENFVALMGDDFVIQWQPLIGDWTEVDTNTATDTYDISYIQCEFYTTAGEKVNLSVNIPLATDSWNRVLFEDVGEGLMFWNLESVFSNWLMAKVKGRAIPLPPITQERSYLCDRYVYVPVKTY